ncbi:MAG: hypothetical protein KDE24_24750, partial [Caldilinea sp.]|nr:hypothetical protein [Caldilinea sp.]
MVRLRLMVAVLVVAGLLLGACRPIVAEPVPAQANEAAMGVIEDFLGAYEAYDVDRMLALHTDDATWTWIDPGKNFPDFGPEGKLVGSGKEAIQAMFDTDRGELGMVGYILFADVQGDTVNATELWENDYTRAIDTPLITQSTYKVR